MQCRPSPSPNPRRARACSRLGQVATHDNRITSVIVLQPYNQRDRITCIFNFGAIILKTRFICLQLFEVLFCDSGSRTRSARRANASRTSRLGRRLGRQTWNFELKQSKTCHSTRRRKNIQYTDQTGSDQPDQSVSRCVCGCTRVRARVCVCVCWCLGWGAITKRVRFGLFSVIRK